VFGKWSKPNYNTVIATWCYNITHNIDIQVNDKGVLLTLVYVDDVIDAFISKINQSKATNYYCEVNTVYKKTLGEIEELLYKFKDNRNTLLIPDVGSGFERCLYATYLSFLSTDDFSYKIKGFEDDRGTFYEILKTLNSGQFSLSTTAPGITRGNQYHHTKNEKFLVVKGEAKLEYKHIVTNEIITYNVSDKNMEVIEMIPGYTHNITNIGSEEMILFLWANEAFDRENPDTYFLEV
jgi:UDP-2-acetamido-2,6-beta-L-arabino-hexul-4-ose reductase